MYKIIVDGYTVGIEELTLEEVRAIETDKDIKLVRIQ